MEVNHFTTNIGELGTDDSIQDHVRDLKPNFSQPPVVGNEKSQCLSSRGLPEESETHPDLDPSANIERVMVV